MTASTKTIVRSDWTGAAGCLGALVPFVIWRIAVLGDVLYVAVLSLPLFLLAISSLHERLGTYVEFSDGRFCYCHAGRKVVLAADKVSQINVMRSFSFHSDPPFYLVLSVVPGVGHEFDPLHASYKQSLGIPYDQFTVSLQLLSFSAKPLGLILLNLACLVPTARVVLLHREIHATRESHWSTEHDEAHKKFDETLLKQLTEGILAAGGQTRHIVEPEFNFEEWILVRPELEQR
jgi:hypothetical protein